jgi:hypothetical protein
MRFLLVIMMAIQLITYYVYEKNQLNIDISMI